MTANDTTGGRREKGPLVAGWLKVLLVIVGLLFFFGSVGAWLPLGVSTRDAPPAGVGLGAAVHARGAAAG